MVSARTVDKRREGYILYPSGNAGGGAIASIRVNSRRREAPMNRMALGVALGFAAGTGLGALIGALSGNLALWLAVGIGAGLSFGAAFGYASATRTD